MIRALRQSLSPLSCLRCCDVEAKKFAPSIFILLVFEAIAVVLWRTQSNPFYLANFTYIGLCVSVGLALYACKWRHVRHRVLPVR